MNWLMAFREDIRRYTNQETDDGLQSQILVLPGLWVLLQYRLASAIYCSSMPSILKRPLLIVMIVWQKLVEVATGVRLPCSAMIGPGLYISHFGNIVLNNGVIIGSNCNLSPGVAIVVSGRSDQRGVPIIGDRVCLGENATVAGKIRVGDDAVIGANSLVVSNVPAGCTVIGVPAVIVSRPSEIVSTIG